MTRRAGWKARLITTIAMIVAFIGTARPVAADTLVTNLSTSASGREGLAGSEYIQSFTTGPNVSGYLLESISIDFVKGSVGARDPVYVYLYEDNGSGRPRSRAIATLTKNGVNFAPPVTGVNKYKVWKARCYPQPPHGGGCLQDPSSVHLAPNTTYWVYVWAGRSTTGAELQSDTATTESGATGWTLGDSAFSKPSWGSSDGVYTYTSISAPLLIKVEGKTIPPVKITIDDASATEGVDLTADFTVSLSRAADGKVTVDYAAIAIETAIANDFEAGTGSLTFQPGETRKTISIPVYDDASGGEGDETFIVRLLRPTGATFEGNASFIDGTGTIVNASVLLIDLAAATGTEASGKIDFRLFLNRATNRPTVISYSVNYNAGASPADLVQETTTGTATIAAGETETTISIGIVDDTISDNNEQFRLEIDKAQGTRGALQRTFRTGTILNSETLEASFENVPQDHDGSNAFTFNVAFTNDVSITPAAMRDHAFTVTNGDVTGASRVDGRNNRWLITVDPDGDDAVTITLPGNRACATQGGICSDEDNPVQLSHSPSVTVAAPPEGDPLTASFSNVPDSHDGGDFKVDLTFSEGPDVGYRDVQKAVKVSGGSINRANRKTKGSNVGWKLKVRPTGTDSLTITLPATTNCSARGAICTEDGRRLSNSPSATVAGPAAVVETTPTVSIAGGSGTEGDDNSIAFTVTLDEAASETVTVDYATADGSAEAGDDYTAASGTLSFAAGETSQAISVAIDDDSDNESDETFTVTLSNASGADLGTKTATGTIRNRTVALLTASFSGVPAEHTGEAFTFALTFSEDVAGLSYLTVRDVALSATGGTVQRARRQQQGSNQGWTIHVEPDSHTAVTVRLPAGSVESSDGRALAHSLSARVAGPVGISVSDARVEEAAGAVLAFSVALTRAASSQLTVDYATSDGTATAGADYTATSGTLTIGAGRSSGTIQVPVLDDDHNEGSESLTLTLSNASSGDITDASATGTITNHDALPKALVARFGRTAAVHIVEQVQERIEAPREVGFEAQFAGRQLRPGMVRDLAVGFLTRLGGSAGAHGDRAGAQGPIAGSPVAGTGLIGAPTGTADGLLGGANPMGSIPGTGDRLNHRGHFGMGLGGGNLLTGSSFVMNHETRRGGILSFWSRGAQSQFAGREGELSLDGRVRTTMFGADYAKGPLITGLSLSHSRGLGGYTGVDVGEVTSSVTGLYPWAGYKVSDRITLWGVTGYGKGALTLTPGAGTALESGLSMALAAGGLRGELADSVVAGFGLVFKADALWVGTAIDGVDGPEGRLAATSAAVTRYRTALEASRGYRFERRLSLQPSLEVGLRRDGGDAETGAGVDLGGGLIVSDALTGLSANLRVRMLLVHQDQGFRDRGVSLSFGYNPAPSTPLGFMAKLTPSWGGQAESGAQALWGRETMAGMADGGPAAGGRLEAELGYGMPVGGRLVGMPSFGIGASGHERDYRLGYGLTVAQGGATHFDLGVYANRRESLGQGTAEHGVGGRLTARW